MSIVLSLQGCMAVGKTTAANYIRNNAPYINTSFEINVDIIEQIKSRHLICMFIIYLPFLFTKEYGKIEVKVSNYIS
ncbi:hypothetical protein [Clostridium lundense]|uniref:hypothetical protein n=1 Tax=Clostridium lundense TaxID=319475 RepID=UPI0004826DDD|nr:hypothetical protein [Clostridium lundense]